MICWAWKLMAYLLAALGVGALLLGTAILLSIYTGRSEVPRRWDGREW